MGDYGFPLRGYCIPQDRKATSLTNRKESNFNYSLSRIRVRIEHLFGSIKNIWKFMMYTSKNTKIIGSIFVLNNICIQLKNNGPMKHYLDQNRNELFVDRETQE